MLIDAHTHIFPPDIRARRAYYCERDPWFNSLYSDPATFIATAEDLISEMDNAQVDASIAFSFGWTDPDLIEETNRYVLDAMQRYPDRIYAMAVLQPLAGKRALTHLQQCAEAGAVGLGELMPHGQGYRLDNIPLLTPFMEIVRHYDMLVMSHCSEPVGHSYPGKGDVSVHDVVSFLTAFPDVRFIAAHWGGGLPFYTLMPEIQRVTSNVWYDTAATIYLYRPAIFITAAQLVGADRILFASDYGLLHQRRVIKHIKDTGLPIDMITKILGTNAAELLSRKTIGFSS